MDGQIDFSLIVVNYRSGRYLAGALESLWRVEDAHQLEVIVVNNDPDESKLLVYLNRTFPFCLLESGSNLGFGGGSNLGARAARGRIIGFINPDTLWGEAKLDGVLRMFEADHSLGALGLLLTGSDGQSERWSYGSEPTLARLLRNNLVPFPDYWSESRGGGLQETLRNVDWVSGGALFVRRDVFVSIGGYDEGFFLYFEDVDLCRRIRQRGYAVKLAPSLSVFHFGGKSHPSSEVQKRHFFVSQDRYFAKHRPAVEGSIVRCFRWLRYGF